MAQRVGELLKARGETVAVAESSLGGLISAAFCAVAAGTKTRGSAVQPTAATTRRRATHDAGEAVAK